MDWMSRLLRLLIVSVCLWAVFAHARPAQLSEARIARPPFVSMNVYTRPNGQGVVQHIHRATLAQDASACFNLYSRHVGAIDTTDPRTHITFFRSKDCQGIPIRKLKPLCSHRSKVLVKAQSVSIHRLPPRGEQ
ncbi:hypothetical protein BC940DRAFT_310820 [Gongronella butleri]|nr:hypothetical protein BC940DRAFT_310820 [Gongronella butleri]